MADTGIRTTNTPQGTLVEVLGHSDSGNGALSLVRMAFADFVLALVNQAGLDPSSVAQVSSRVTALEGILISNSGSTLQVVDERGNVLLQFDGLGLHLPGGVMAYSHRSGQQTVDALGYVLSQFSPERFSRQDIRDHNARAMAYSVAARQPLNNDTAGLVWNLNHVIGWGQSLMAGQECWPALTTAGRSVPSEPLGSDTLMIGQSVRSGNQGENAFNPQGDSTLRPLVATVQPNNGGAPLTASQQAALTGGVNGAGDPSNGETPVEGALFTCQRLLDLYAPQSLYRLLGTNVAVGGQSIEQLRNNYFGRVTGSITAGKAAAAGQGWTYGVAAILWAQGEANYSASGGTSDMAAYQALLASMYADIATAAANMTGQTDQPLMVTYQTSAGFVQDATGLSIGMAQWNLSKADPRFALATPSYPFPDKGLHLDPNGSRWMGIYYGKVLFTELVLRKRWRPLEPIEAITRGRQVLVLFSVPAPPLRWQSVFEMNNLIDHGPGRGFTVTDALGARANIVTAEVAGEACVLLTLDREPRGPLQVWYGRLDDSYGGGNLCDSDPMTAPLSYAYSAGSGQYSSANITQFVGKPYPLANWCVCFNIPAVAG